MFPYVEVEHSGNYEIIATNSRGEESVQVKLSVYPETDLLQATDSETAITSVAIRLSEFGQYVANLHGHNNKKFKEQFKVSRDLIGRIAVS